VFDITPASGVISLASLLDREKCDWYNLTVSATNAVSNSNGSAAKLMQN